MTDPSSISRWLTYRQSEIDGAATYHALAELESQPQLKQVYASLAKSEDDHVAFWETKLKEAAATFPPPRPSLRSRILVFLARRLGPSFVVPTLAMHEQAARNEYDDQPEAREAKLSNSEHSHARLLTAIASAKGAGMEGGALARLEGRHRSIGGNALRAAVLGANDGLCSTLSLVMGVAGAGQPSPNVLIAGLAGILAGACAMAMGEWLSVQSARELAQSQLAVEEAELREAPEEEQHELALIYQAKGLPKPEAESLAAKLIADKTTALDTLAREELGLNPEELGGSAWEAAIASFFLFIVGAIAPILPFFFLTGPTAIIGSLLASTVALFLIGFAITLMTGRSVLFTGTRQVLIGLAAAAITFGVGHLIGKLFGLTIAA
ncbi:MAG: VIT1/CCC1 transporter family protein [Planctomycetota bacterium]|nr:VIT1/CCC1 transporter family protein [Planctomycetota bacterium]